LPMNAKILVAATAAALAMSLSVSGAKASRVQPAPGEVFFTITTDTNPTTIMTFETLESPSPSSYVLGSYFELDAVPITVNGSPSGTDDFQFYNGLQGGGLDESGGYFGAAGITAAQLYSGPENAPTFVPGTYQGTYTPFAADPGVTITISTTPLPSTWMMLCAGFAGLGFFAYRGTRKRTALAVA
jgi:hypothetical protein